MELLHQLCTSTDFILMLTMSCIFTSASPTPCEMAMSVNISSPLLLGNESVLDQTSNIAYPPGTHWSLVDQGVKKYRGCPCKIYGRPCLRKCCPLGEMLRNRNCVPHNTTFVVNVTDNGKNFQVVEGIKHFSLIFGEPCNSTMHGLIPLSPKTFAKGGLYINSTDGRLVYPQDTSTLYGPNSYCIDHFSEHDAYNSLLCAPKEYEGVSNEEEYARHILYPVLMTVSIVFLLVTLVVYVTTPDLRNLHGKCLMCQISSLTVAYVFLVVGYIALIIQFSFLSTFFWLNIMCFDISLTFSDMRPMVGSINEKEKKKFILYSLYAWSCPIIILIITIVMEFSPGILHHHKKPRFGTIKCWFENDIDAIPYFYGPVAVLLTSNVIMFILTALKILKLNKQVDVLRKEGCRSSDEHKENRHRFNIYTKLLVVMGINWIMEVISWAVGGPHYLWYLTDIGNALQGFLIFFIFVWKDKILNTVLEKFCPKFAAKRKESVKSARNWRSLRRYSSHKSSRATSDFAIENLKLKSMKSNSELKTNI